MESRTPEDSAAACKEAIPTSIDAFAGRPRRLAEAAPYSALGGGAGRIIGSQGLMKKRLQITALVVFVAATAAALIADQAPTPQPQAQTPTFKLQVDYVEVDAVVTDRDGNLVKDLKKEDFQVVEDGKAQTISLFSQVDIPIERADRPLNS